MFFIRTLERKRFVYLIVEFTKGTEISNKNSTYTVEIQL